MSKKKSGKKDQSKVPGGKAAAARPRAIGGRFAPKGVPQRISSSDEEDNFPGAGADTASGSVV